MTEVLGVSVIRLKLQLVDVNGMEQRAQKHDIKTKMETMCETRDFYQTTGEKREETAKESESRGVSSSGDGRKNRLIL